MRIFMIGDVAQQADVLSDCLSGRHEIVELPHEAGRSARFDGEIGAGDVVIATEFRREGAGGPPFALLHVPGAGAERIDFDTLAPATAVCNVFEHEIPMAEFTFATMLEWEIGLATMRETFTPQTWGSLVRSRVPHGELFGKTIAIVGFGRIGRAIAERARAFGMTVIAVARRPDGGPADEIVPTDALKTILPRADYVVVAVPFTPDTRDMVGADELAAMKTTAVLINVSRGGVVAEEALFEALSTRVIGGAVIDVWYAYPDGPDHNPEPSRFPFHSLANVIATPHSSAWTHALPRRRYAIIADNIARLADGRPLLNVIRAPVSG